MKSLSYTTSGMSAPCRLPTGALNPGRAWRIICAQKIKAMHHRNGYAGSRLEAGSDKWQNFRCLTSLTHAWQFYMGKLNCTCNRRRLSDHADFVMSGYTVTLVGTTSQNNVEIWNLPKSVILLTPLQMTECTGVLLDHYLNYWFHTVWAFDAINDFRGKREKNTIPQSVRTEQTCKMILFQCRIYCIGQQNSPWADILQYVD